MAFTDHYRLQFGGSLGAGTPAPEIWSCSINLASIGTVGGDAANPVSDGALNDAADDVAAFIADPRMKFSNQVGLTYVKLNRINELGHYADEVTHEKAVSPVVTGVSGSPIHPYQCSLFATLKAPGRGRDRRGGFFCPPTTHQLDGSGLIQIGDRDSAADALQAFLQALSEWPGLDTEGLGSVVIASQVSGNHLVTECRIGRVFDTHRSRRNALHEAYAVRPL